MGWDVIIINTNDVSTAGIEAGALPSFGQRRAMQHKLNEMFPGIEREENLQHGHLDTEDYFGNIDLGEHEEMPGCFGWVYMAAPTR